MSSLMVGSILISSTRSGWRNVPSSWGGAAAGVCPATKHCDVASNHAATSAKQVLLRSRIRACLRTCVGVSSESLHHRAQAVEDFLFGQRADQPVNFAPAFEDEQGRNAAHAEARRRLRVLVYVELADFDPPAQLCRQLFNDGGD